MLHVDFDCAVRDFENLCNFTVGQTRGNAAEHFILTIGKKLRNGRVFCRLLLYLRAQMIRQRRSDLV